MRKPFAIILSATLVLAGCSDDPADEGGLLGALGRVAATAETRKAVEYGEPAAIKALVDKDKTRYQSVQGYGYGSISSYGKLIEEKLGLDLDVFEGGLVAGEPPKQATVLWGTYDVSTVDGKLRGLDLDGEKTLGGTLWRSADDYEISLEDGPFTEVAPPAQFNDILTGDKAFAFAPAAAGIDWVTRPGDSTLAGDAVLAPLAKCLGDVIAARLEATGEAAGVRRDGSEVICLRGDQAQVSKALKGTVPSANEPWAEVLPGATVDQDGPLARVTVPARSGKPAGQVLRVMLNGDLRGLH